MAYEFQKLSEVEALAEVPEGANALIEVNGDIKRVPGSGLGGATGIKTAIIKSSDYDDAVAGLINSAPKVAASAPSITYECLNMTFEEAYEIMSNGEPLQAVLMLAGDGAMNINAFVGFFGVSMGTPCIGIAIVQNTFDFTLFWTVDGISTEQPGGDR